MIPEIWYVKKPTFYSTTLLMNLHITACAKNWITLDSQEGGFQGQHIWNSLDYAWKTIMKSSGYKTEPWCTPTLNSNVSLYEPFTLTLNSSTNPFRYTYHTHSPSLYFMWYSIENLFKINETKIKVFIFDQKFFLKLSDNEDNISCPLSRNETKLHSINDFTFPDDFFKQQ